jgi:hypothetical protein
MRAWKSNTFVSHPGYFPILNLNRQTWPPRTIHSSWIMLQPTIYGQIEVTDFGVSLGEIVEHTIGRLDGR